MLAIRIESRGLADLPPAARRQGRRAVRDAQAAHDGRRRGVHGRRARGEPRATRASRASARSCGASRSTSCRTSSTSLRGEMAIVGPRPTIQAQVDQYTERQMRRLEVKPGITGWAQVNGRASLPWARADRARRLVRRPQGAAARPEDPAADDPDARERRRPLQGRDGRMDRPDRDVAVLLTGVGKRYDIVSAFAEHAFVVAADPSPLAPAQYAADVRVAPPRIDDPGYVPFLEELVARARRQGGDPADGPRPRGARALRPARVRPRAARSAARPTTSTRRTSCCCRTACRARRRCCPARSPSPTR